MGETCCQVGWNSPCPSFLFSFPSLHLLAFRLEQNNKHQPENTILAKAAHKGILRVVLQAWARAPHRSSGGTGGASRKCLSAARGHSGSHDPRPHRGPANSEGLLLAEAGQRAASLRLQEDFSAPSFLKTGPLSLFPPCSRQSSGREPGPGLRECSQIKAADGFQLGACGGVGSRLRGERCPGEKCWEATPAGSTLPLHSPESQASLHCASHALAWSWTCITTPMGEAQLRNQGPRELKSALSPFTSALKGPFPSASPCLARSGHHPHEILPLCILPSPATSPSGFPQWSQYGDGLAREPGGVAHPSSAA